MGNSLPTEKKNFKTLFFNVLGAFVPKGILKNVTEKSRNMSKYSYIKGYFIDPFFIHSGQK